MQTKRIRPVAALSLIAPLCCGSRADAQYFALNAIINYPINSVVVGYASASDYNHGVNGASPTVVLVNGGQVASSLRSYNHSIVNISGGSILSGLEAYDNSAVTVSGGSVAGSIYASDSSRVAISSGAIGGSLFAYNSGSITLFGLGLSSQLLDRYANFGLYSQYALYGKLADGADISGAYLYLRNGDSASFTLVNVTGAVAGQITLEGVLDVTRLATPVGGLTVEFRAPGTSPHNAASPQPALFTRTALSSATADHTQGAYTVTGVLPGTYDIAIKSRNSLRKVIPGVAVGNDTVTLPPILLRAGDANNDNFVNTTDFGLLVGVYGSDATLPSSGYDPACDFNYDGSVDTTDFGLLVGNYDSAGDL